MQNDKVKLKSEKFRNYFFTISEITYNAQCGRRGEIAAAICESPRNDNERGKDNQSI